MKKPSNESKAIFISSNGEIYPDTMICSGIIPSILNGQVCPFSEHGHIPDPVNLSKEDSTYTVDKGNPGELCPPCAKQQLGALGHWQGHNNQDLPEELLALRLFKCRQWFWLVIPGLRDDKPTDLEETK
jgi:hypothetical protein